MAHIEFDFLNETIRLNVDELDNQMHTRIFVDHLNSDSRRMPVTKAPNVDYIESGALSRLYHINDDSQIVAYDYILYLEKRFGLSMDFTDDEIETFEDLLVNYLNNNI